ncbi:MAG: hypothetical protein WC861_01520 [Candidatus Micrarchaeia archaeon]|jgi:hypothetical protein
MMGNTAFVREFDPKVEKIIVVGSEFCADSRNTTEAYYSAKENVINGLSRQGIMVDFFRMNDAGVYMTPMASAEFMWHFMQKKIEYSQFALAGVPIEYQLHVVAHANARHTPEYAGKHTFDPQALEILKGHCTNCGMEHADAVAATIQNSLISTRPTLMAGGREISIYNESNLREFMRETYKGRGAPDGWDGNLLTLVTPIHDLRAHSLEQIRAFEAEAQANSHFMREIPEVKTFACLLNYTNNKLYRVDGKSAQEDLVLRPIFQAIRENPSLPSDHETRVDKQAKLWTPALLISDPYVAEARKLFSKNVLKVKYSAGTIFSVARMMQSGPFDWPSMLGAFYDLSPQYLNGRDQGTLGIVGRKVEGINFISGKVMQDQVMSQAVNTYVKDIHSFGVANPRQSFPTANPNLDRFIAYSMQARRR